MSKSEYVTVQGAAYHAPSVAAQSFEDFKKESIEQSANTTNHFSQWGPVKQAELLKEVWDAAKAAVPDAAKAEKPTKP